jgi:hypothetical protein
LLTVVERIAVGSEEISCCPRIVSGDFADDSREGAEDGCPSSKYLHLCGLDVDLYNVGHGEARGQPVQCHRGHKLRSSDATRLTGAEAIEMAGGAVATCNVKSGHSQVIRDGYGKHLDRRLAVIGGG